MKLLHSWDFYIKVDNQAHVVPPPPLLSDFLSTLFLAPIISISHSNLQDPRSFSKYSFIRLVIYIHPPSPFWFSLHVIPDLYLYQTLHSPPEHLEFFPKYSLYTDSAVHSFYHGLTSTISYKYLTISVFYKSMF